jgi:acyl dehydratase
MAVTEPEAVMPQAVITDEMTASMTAKVGAVLRIDHSVNNELASRIAVTKFAGGIGDINPLWTDQDYACNSPYGAPVAPPSFIIGCFSGIQFGWPGLGSFHSQSHLTFERPVYWGDVVNATCVYEGFDGPSPSSFAGRTVTDKFRNTYVNQRGEQIATISWQVINFERGQAPAPETGEPGAGRCSRIRGPRTRWPRSRRGCWLSARAAPNPATGRTCAQAMPLTW